MAITGAVSGPAGRSSRAEVRVVEFGSRERRRRAWLGLAGWWAGASMAAFLPVGRVPLAAGLATAGVYSAVRRYRTARVVVEVIGDCPECGAAQALEVPHDWEPPAPVTCRACRAKLAFAIQPSSESA
jgi:hypothetical protein